MKRIYIILIIAAALLSAVSLLTVVYFWNLHDNMIKNQLKVYHPAQQKFEKKIYESLDEDDKQKLDNFWKTIKRKRWKSYERIQTDTNVTSFGWVKEGSDHRIVVDPEMWNNKIEEREELIAKYLPHPNDEKQFLKQYHKEIADDDKLIDSLYGSARGSLREKRLALQDTWTYSPPADGYCYGGQWKHKWTQEVVNVKPDRKIEFNVRPILESTIVYSDWL